MNQCAWKIASVIVAQEQLAVKSNISTLEGVGTVPLGISSKLLALVNAVTVDINPLLLAYQWVEIPEAACSLYVVVIFHRSHCKAESTRQGLS